MVKVKPQSSSGVLYRLLSRQRRWDYSNGCHCHGYHMECMRDLFCQTKHHSEHWSCQETCCGFICVHGDVDTRTLYDGHNSDRGNGRRPMHRGDRGNHHG
ncbi:hypothetical protein ElyMa_005670900 [Elysia marginata]|uniref:Uncharacterized protein n=1 Tax=Elysia marginata TaxID=1093978 RepID=A0AAV4FE01_9GAST|nr:hypothetical protein ElyMa_005670900 [Elysia marginata]